MKRFHHGFLFDAQNSAIRHRGCRVHAERLARERTFAEESSLTHDADRCFLASLRNHGEFYLAGLKIKHRIRRIPLRKDSLFPLEKQKFPALANRCEECMGIEIAFLLGY